MAGRRIVVTGGTAGIGLAVAQRLGQQGDAVFVCGRDGERVQQAVASISVSAPSAAVSGAICDVRQLGSVAAMIEEARGHLGGIDGLVNSAGIGFIKDFEDITPTLWSEIVETNLTGVFNCCHAALPHLKEAAAERGVADIVNLGSRSGRYAFKGGVGYNTTKFGLQGLTEAMFLDLHKYGVRVGLVAPGTVATGFGGTDAAEWHLQPGDVAEAVVSMIGARAGACLNWVEMRPARPPT